MSAELSSAVNEATLFLASYDAAMSDPEQDLDAVARQDAAHLAESLRAVLAALSTPPADDVREAVMNALACHRRKVTIPAFNRPVCSCGWASTTVDYGAYAFDGHIADAVAAEVRPRGTVTDAEVNRVQEGAGERGAFLQDWEVRAVLEAARLP